MKTLHLFAGAGGGLLADLILGHEPVAAVEWDAYCCQVLRERAAEGWFPDLQVFEGDVRLFDASAWEGRVDLIAGGFPCPPFSVAGKRLGADDPRNMWPATGRIIGEVRPEWVFLENVCGFVSSGYGWTVLSDLSSLGYDAVWTCLGADQVGAPHRRERWWLLAHAQGREIGERKRGDVAQEASGRKGVHTTVDVGGSAVADTTIPRRREWEPEESRTIRDEAWREEPERRGGSVDHSKGGTRQRETPRETGHAPFAGQDVADACIQGLEGQRSQSRKQKVSESGDTGSLADSTGQHEPRGGGTWAGGEGFANGGWWDIEPDLGRVANGVASRVDRLKGLGNGQVPLQAALAFRALIGRI